MKKLLVMILVGVMTMSVLTGCGKSEEEKAMDEMASHIIDEAAEDGVDLEEMLEEEYEAYEERHEENMKENQMCYSCTKKSDNRKNSQYLEICL